METRLPLNVGTVKENDWEEVGEIGEGYIYLKCSQ